MVIGTPAHQIMQTALDAALTGDWDECRNLVSDLEPEPLAAFWNAVKALDAEIHQEQIRRH